MAWLVSTPPTTSLHSTNILGFSFVTPLISFTQMLLGMQASANLSTYSAISFVSSHCYFSFFNFCSAVFSDYCFPSNFTPPPHMYQDYSEYQTVLGWYSSCQLQLIIYSTVSEVPQPVKTSFLMMFNTERRQLHAPHSLVHIFHITVTHSFTKLEDFNHQMTAVF
jgi:hypothetical protein